jgi:hypothetical protein
MRSDTTWTSPAESEDPDLTDVELKTFLAQGQSALAYRLDDAGNRLTESIITIYGSFWLPGFALGSDNLSGDGSVTGARGQVVWHQRRQRWEVLQMQVCQGVMEAQLAETLAPGSNICNVCFTTGGATFVAQNPYGLDGPVNSNCLLVPVASSTSPTGVIFTIVAVAPTVSYAYARAYAQDPAAAAGGSLVLTDIGGFAPGIVAGNGTTGTLAVTYPGAYLLLGGLSVNPQAATTPDAGFEGAIGINGPPLFGGNLIPDAYSHFHCLTDPAGTPNWQITVAGVAYDLPQLPSASGTLSIAKIVHLNAGDQIGLFVQSAVDIEVALGYLVAVRIGS